MFETTVMLHFSSAYAVFRTLLSALKCIINVVGLEKPVMTNMKVLSWHLFTEIEETLGEEESH